MLKFAILLACLVSARAEFLPDDHLPEGTYTIQQMHQGRGYCHNCFLDAYTSGHDYQVYVTSGTHSADQEWILRKGKCSICYTLQQNSSRRYLDAYEDAKRSFRAVMRTHQTDDSQQWQISEHHRSDDTWTMVQTRMVHGRYLWLNDDWTVSTMLGPSYWKFTPVTATKTTTTTTSTTTTTTTTSTTTTTTLFEPCVYATGMVETLSEELSVAKEAFKLKGQELSVAQAHQAHVCAASSLAAEPASPAAAGAAKRSTAVPLPVLVAGMAASSLVTFLLVKYYENGMFPERLRQPLLES
mmetsp:Transcript_150936/g.278272  ORF Transcript_150936/g.278272 Transcript_150936/m.278272 type:complete len:298 (+) Transcript_150936:71-964(+)